VDPRQQQHDPFITLAAAGLAALVDPLTPDAFLDEYWEQQSIHLPRPAGRPPGLGFGVREFSQTAALLPPGGISARFRRGEESRHIQVNAEQIEPLRAGGMSIHLHDLQRAHPGMALLLGRLRAELGFTGHLTCDAHLSSACAGHEPRLESHSVLHLQLGGSQTWAYGRGPALSGPPASVSAAGLGGFRLRFPWAAVPLPHEEKLRSSVLQPGDALYLPSGTWHEALATEHSLGLSICFHGQSLHGIVAAALQDALRPHAVWRRTPRPARSMPPTLREHFAARASELRDLVGRQLTGDWLAAHCYPPVPTEEAPVVAPDERLVAPRPLHHQPGVAEVRVDGVALPIEALLFAAHLVRALAFSAREAMTWPGMAQAYSAGEVGRWLDALVTAGALVPENIQGSVR
jgi:hypothetical protein